MTTMSIIQTTKASSPPKTSLEEEMVKAAQKNIQAFEKLYDKHYEEIFRYVYQRVSGKDEAFDITSQIFIKAMTNIDKFKFKGFPFSSWLYRIAKSEVYQYFRDIKKSPTLNIDETNLSELSDDIVENTTTNVSNEKLIEILSNLSDEDLPFIEMRYLEQRSFKEIGEILGTTENNAKVKTHRIIKRIQKNV
jgi:RNA polymerase sigma-70 factor (ECF subfamily)